MFQGRSDFELEKSTTDIMRLKNVGKGKGNGKREVQNVQNRNFPTKTLSLNEVVGQVSTAVGFAGFFADLCSFRAK